MKLSKEFWYKLLNAPDLVLEYSEVDRYKGAKEILIRERKRPKGKRRYLIESNDKTLKILIWKVQRKERG